MTNGQILHLLNELFDLGVKIEKHGVGVQM